ncbi:MAG TPA: transglutaminase-like cysteine peptidase [Hyphomicrobium sp.]|uniref:transglutaminase-like cysteine peptidase n=1 Tax=Hyphomicrobium sp. TaxID=82 RepID=UPI002C319580|nr:transglutaminase-like cysteine peptidase [Hyphomicrobium sp.]HRN89113.1 transglutaminase-like cysteine peptidase [Hyphomicrobium sp.]
MKRIFMCIAAMAAIAGPAGAMPEVVPPATNTSSSPFMRVYGPAQPPYGFVRFCERNPDACRARHIEDIRFQPTPERLSELDEVNRWVNHAIAPATDMEIYGVSEFWTFPVDRGDCEDYALLKQKILIQRGWPKSSLLLTVVRDEKGEGHAVLTARTSQGDFVLDNKIDDVRLWNASGYYFLMRQSYLDPRVWVSLDVNDRTAPDAIAGVQDGR